MKVKRRLLAVYFTALLFIISGCTIAEIDELYSLPQPSKEYLQLQELIDAEIDAGSEYAAPTSGSLRQSIQLVDLNGNGSDEAIAFLRNKDMQPVICIYHKADEKYELVTKIIGDGSAVGRVDYADLNSDGISEILISWEVNSEMRLLKVYSIINWNTSVLLTESCVDFQISDLNFDKTPDIVVLSLEMSGGQVNMFSVEKNKDVIKKSVNLSGSLKKADRFRIANINNGVPAVFVEGPYNLNESNFLLTDIIVYLDGELLNITLDEDSADSFAKRQFPIYCIDIDGSGSLDVPFVKKLDDSQHSISEHYLFDWYTYDAGGKNERCASTYHCYTDGWFFILPEGWRDNLTIRRVNNIVGERAIVFSIKNPKSDKITDLLTIFTLTDENRIDRAKLGNRFVLIDSGTVIYAAEINISSGLSADEGERRNIISRFHLISSEWINGAI